MITGQRMGNLALELSGEAQGGGEAKRQFLAITLSKLMAAADSVAWEEEASLVAQMGLLLSRTVRD